MSAMTPSEARLVLGVNQDAGPAEVKAAYHSGMKLVHPDRAGDLPDAVRKQAAVKAKQLNEAYELLRNASTTSGGPGRQSATGTGGRASGQPRTEPVVLVECSACGEPQGVAQSTEVHACVLCRTPLFHLTCRGCRQEVGVWGLGAWRCGCGRVNENRSVVVR